MPAFALPADPLLQQALIPRDPFPGANNPADPNIELDDNDNPGSSSDEDDERRPNSNKRPRLGANDALIDPTLLQNPTMAPPLPTSLRQYAQNLISLKKLSDNSQQELHRYTVGSAAERDAMNFALGLEIRDVLGAISNAVVSTNLHADLITNIKAYTAAAFFSPYMRYYAPPTNSTRNKNLQKAILEQLKAFGLSHIPPSSDVAGIHKVLSAIGTELTDWRSKVKEELAKRKSEEPNMDIGSFSARVMRNASIQVTREHYGRIAMLSREYSLWESRPEGLVKAKFWEWVDKALERIREQQKNDPEGVKRFFKDLMSQDETKFSKAIGKVTTASDREEWQKEVELATSKLT